MKIYHTQSKTLDISLILQVIFYFKDATNVYHKTPKISDTRKFAVITLKVEQDGFTLEYCIQKLQGELQTV